MENCSEERLGDFRRKNKIFCIMQIGGIGKIRLTAFGCSCWPLSSLTAVTEISLSTSSIGFVAEKINHFTKLEKQTFGKFSLRS
jgi:hypothetical protein